MLVELVSTPASRLLTTVARVQSEASISGDDALLADFVEQASSQIELWAGRPLYRAQWRETRSGSALTRIDLSRYPIASLESATYVSTTYADIQLSVPSTGFLYRAGGFTDNGEPDAWSFTYTAGWVTPESNLINATVSVLASDSSYNGTFPADLKPGDLLIASGFTDSANNGTKVIGTASTTKLEVTTALVDEGSAVRSIRLHNLPGWVERVAIDLVKSNYTNRSASSALDSIRIGDAEMSWDQAAAAVKSGLAGTARSLGRLNF